MSKKKIKKPNSDNGWSVTKNKVKINKMVGINKEV